RAVCVDRHSLDIASVLLRQEVAMRYVVSALVLSFLLAAGALAVPANKTADKTVQLHVPGMTCPLCPITVRKALERVPGVQNISVDFPARTVRVVYDPTQVRVAALLKAAANAGYP